jgi:hypothetical protein
MTTHITAITRTATGWEYTTDINAAHYFDVYDDQGELLLSAQTDGEFELVTADTTPPRVSIDYYQDYLTPYLTGAIVASNNTILQWLSMGAAAYHVERYDGAQWLSIAVVTGNDMYLQYTHRSALALAPDTTWRITPCEGDTLEGVAATGEPVQFDVIQIGYPAVPAVTLSVADGVLTVAAVGQADAIGGADDGL